jgi:hypothetical protein
MNKKVRQARKSPPQWLFYFHLVLHGHGAAGKTSKPPHPALRDKAVLTLSA